MKRCQFSSIKQPTWLMDFIKGFTHILFKVLENIHNWYFEDLVLCFSYTALSESTVLELLTSGIDILSWLVVFVFLCWNRANWSYGVWGISWCHHLVLNSGVWFSCCLVAAVLGSVLDVGSLVESISGKQWWIQKNGDGLECPRRGGGLGRLVEKS